MLKSIYNQVPRLEPFYTAITLGVILLGVFRTISGFCLEAQDIPKREFFLVKDFTLSEWRPGDFATSGYLSNALHANLFQGIEMYLWNLNNHRCYFFYISRWAAVELDTEIG
jgi:hypothetical protein